MCRRWIRLEILVLLVILALAACRSGGTRPAETPSPTVLADPTATVTRQPTETPPPTATATYMTAPAVTATRTTAPAATATQVPMIVPMDGRDFDWSPDGQAVVMTGFAEPRHIWIAHEPDFAAAPLSDQAGHHPRWSPGGKYIAFAGPRENGQGETVWLIHADGSNLRDLLRDQEATHSTSKSIERWLDDHTVIFSDNCGTGCRRPAAVDIYTRKVEAYPEGGQRYHWTAKGNAYVSVAGGGVPKIGLWQQADRGTWQEMPLPRPAEFHSWSPDGQAFLFSYWSWAEGQGAPYAVTSHVPTLALWDLGQGEARDLVSGGYHGAWSPDGERIAFFLLGDPIYDVQGQLAGTDLVPGQPFALSLAVWDLPSARVVSITPILDRFDPSAYEEIGVAAGFAARRPWWSPDGRWLAYWETGYEQQAWYDDTGGDLWLVDRDGAQRQKLTEGEGVTQAMWSPDSARLALVVQQQLNVIAVPSLDARTVQPAQAVRPTVPAGCVVRDADSLPYFNVRDGYCLRCPTGFQVGEVFPGVANIYGHPRTPGPEPLLAGLVVMVQDLDGEETLAEVADRFLREQQRVGWLDPVTRTLTVLGGQPAMLLEGPGEYTSLHILLTVHDGRRYTLSISPDPDEFSLVAEDVEALWQTVPLSFSFLPEGFSEPPAGIDPDTTPLLLPEGTLCAWEIPRLVFERADHSLWATALDGGEPWPLTGPLPGETDALQWSLSPDGRRIAMVQSAGFRREGQLPGGTLSLIDLATGKQEIILRSLLPPNDGWQSLPDDADRAVLWENRPAWSPDGAHVAFVSAHGGSADLYAYTLASGELRHIAAGESNAAWPRWSPDGRHIVYTAVAYFGVGAGPTTNGLRVVPADGASPTRQLTGGGKQDQQLVAWVDTTQILSASYSLMGERDLEAIAIERGTRIPLVEGELAGLAWSEAAGLVAVSPGEENATVPTGLYLVDPRGPDAPLQIANQAVRNPRWSPGGRYLTHTTGDDCTLYDRELGTAHLVRGEWCGGTWSPDDHYLAYVDTSLKLVHVESGESEQISRYYEARTIRWSPDGEWMTWLRETRGGRYDLYALRPGAGRPFRAVTDLPAHGWPELGWVPGFPRDVGTTPVVTLTADTGVRIPVDAACDRVAEVLTFRKGLFYREPLERGRRQRLSLPCRLDRQAPEAGLVATEIFYQSLRFSPDRRWLIVENDNHAPCLLDLETLEGRLLPAETRVSWSPQGRQFAYVEREWSPDGPAPPHGTLMIHDAYDDTRQALWSQSGLYDVLWSPDGTRLATWAFTNEHGKRFWILDLQGTVHLTGTYAYSIHEPPLFWSPDGQRLAVSKMQPGTNYFEWEILSLEGGTTGRVDWDEVLSSPDWHPNREREAQSASSHSGAFVAQAMPPPRSKEVDWWQAPSTLRIIDAGSGATVRAWQIDGFVPTVRWSAGDGWLVYALLDIEDRQENCELGPCGIHASIWRVRVDGAGEPEMVVGNGFLVEVYE